MGGQTGRAVELASQSLRPVLPRTKGSSSEGGILARMALCFSSMMHLHPTGKNSNNWLARRQRVAADAKADGTMQLRDWHRYQRDVDELLASYAFAAAASGLVLLAGR